MSYRSSPTNSTSTSPSTTCRRAPTQVEQDRAPPLLVHQPKLARSTARQLSCHRRPDLGDDHKDRPHRALRDRRDPLPEGHHCLRRRNGGHQHHPTRFPRRMELHYRAKLRLKPSVRLRTGPKVIRSSLSAGGTSLGDAMAGGASLSPRLFRRIEPAMEVASLLMHSRRIRFEMRRRVERVVSGAQQCRTRQHAGVDIHRGAA